MTKKESRVLVNNLRKQLSAEEVRLRSNTVFNNLIKVRDFCDAKNIYVYVSYNNEVDTYPIIEYCFSHNKNVFVPKVYGDEMKFHEISSFDELAPGAYGIMEPVNDFDASWNDICGTVIMPGVAFDRNFNRAGYGGGFYDKYLSFHNNLKKIAVCFDFQIVDKIDVQDYDLQPDIIVCESDLLFNCSSL